MKFVALQRDGTPIYQNYRFLISDNEEDRIKNMLGVVFRTQPGSEILPDYGFDAESAIKFPSLLNVLAGAALSNLQNFPGINAFGNIEAYVSGNTGYINVTAYTSSGTVATEVQLNELQ